jgi:flagellar motility protein MotE (MotC chaperone)
MLFGFVVLLLGLCFAPRVLAEQASSADDSGQVPTRAQLDEALGLAAQALERQRREISEEKYRLEQLRDEIRADLARLEKMLARLEEPMDEDQQRQLKERGGRIRHVAKSLAAMEPKAAAVAIAKMEDGLAVELLSVVDGKKVGKILEAMDTQRAAVLMQKVINRNSGGESLPTKAGG